MKNLNQRGTQIGRCSFDSQGTRWHPANADRSNFYVHVQQLKVTTQLRDTNGKWAIEEKKTYYTVILRTTLHKEGIEKEWMKFEQNPQDLIQQAKI